MIAEINNHIRNEKEASANAQRIVKAVNMHDELMEIVKDAYQLGDFDIAGLPTGRLGGREQEEERILLKEKMKSVIKQSEQK